MSIGGGMPSAPPERAARLGYETNPTTKPPDWHGLVAWDMLLNNLTTGLFLVAALGEWAVPQAFSPIAKIAYPIALVLLLADLVCLVLDLGDPLRFHHMLRVFKPSSPMSLGVWSLTIYSLPLTAVVVIDLLPGEWAPPAWVRTLVVALGLLPALASAVYKGVLFSVSAQPGWKDARWLGAYLTSSALLLGCAEMLALAVLMHQESAIRILRLALGLLLVLNAVPLGLLVADLRPNLARTHSPRQLVRTGALALGGGMLLPLGLLLGGDHPFLLIGAVLFLLLGSLVIRFGIVYLPHPHP
jgi:hypothetical protein